jgi:hypothetical protein
MGHFGQIVMKPLIMFPEVDDGRPRAESGLHLGGPQRCLQRRISCQKLSLEWIIANSLVRLRQTTGLGFVCPPVRLDQMNVVHLHRVGGDILSVQIFVHTVEENNSVVFF